jgi:hypothetical protein
MKKPICVHEHNTMNEVDLIDQMLAPYCIPRKRLKKYYKKIFMILFDFSILNSNLLYKIHIQETSGDVMTQLQFRIALARSLLTQNSQNNLPIQLVRRETPSNEPTPA